MLPLVLTGQPELSARLNEPELRQLKQRITLRCELEPFSRDETAAYIAMRVRTAGGDARQLFTREAVMMIHEKSRGIPRTISVICDNALITGFALERKPVDSKIIAEVADDFDLGKDEKPSEGVRAPAVATRANPPAQPPVQAREAVPLPTPVVPIAAAEQVAAAQETAVSETPAPELFAAVHKTEERFSLFRGRSRNARS